MPACPLCQREGTFHAKSMDIEYFTISEPVDIMRCDACDILFVHPMLTDKLDVIYPPNYYAYDDGAGKSFAVRVKEMLDRANLRRLLRQIPGESLNVLDVGGGTGWLASLARSVDPRVKFTQIVDLDRAAAAKAEANGHRYFCGRIEDFQTDVKFDLILMLNLIEHVAHPDEILRKTAELLSPTGRLLLKTPNFRALDAVIFRNQSWGGYHCPRHFVLFSRKSLENTMREAGLATEQFSYTQGAPFWAVSIMDLLRRIGLVKFTGRGDDTVAQHKLTPFIQAAAAVFDFARRPFSRLSQMIVVARSLEASAKN